MKSLTNKEKAWGNMIGKEKCVSPWSTPWQLQFYALNIAGSSHSCTYSNRMEEDPGVLVMRCWMDCSNEYAGERNELHQNYTCCTRQDDRSAATGACDDCTRVHSIYMSITNGRTRLYVQQSHCFGYKCHLTSVHPNEYTHIHSPTHPTRQHAST